jgi:enoyl-CoA hydratase
MPASLPHQEFRTPIMPNEDQFQTITCTRENAIATVTLNRPEALNALNALMFDELERIFVTLAGDELIRVILITGSGERAFAAGADIPGLVNTDATSGEAVSLRGQHVFAAIERCGKAVIACINGVALGGGCELALACTLRLAAEPARFGLPEARLGLIPGYGGTQRLARLVGSGRALRMMLTAQIIDAHEALRIGLVEEVVPSADLMTRAREVAHSIASMAPLAIAGILEATNRTIAPILDDRLRIETGIFGRLCGTRDKQEGLTAFLQKRPPVWQGK